MSTLPMDLVGDAHTSTHSWELLNDLVDIDNRMAGQQGEADGANLVQAAFENHGLHNIKTDSFDIPGWWRERCSLTIERDRTHSFTEQHQIIELPGTPSSTVDAEIVDVGHGLPADFETADVDGKIAMASSLTPENYDRWLHRSEKYSAAVNAGAVAFVFRNHVEGCLPPTGSIGNENGPGDIPAVGVSKEIGDRLVRYSKDGPLPARLELECRNEPATSRNIEAVVGPDTEQEVLLTAHVDAHDVGEGANDNGVGTVLVTEIGRLLTKIEDELDTRVRCIVFGSEEVGLYGAYHWVDTHNHDKIKCVLNIDGAGYSRTLDVYTHGFDVIGEVFHEVSEDLHVPIDISSNIRPHSDHWPFVQEGIPGAQLRSTTEENGRGWGHTHADTLDKLDIRDIRSLAVSILNGVVKLASEDKSPESKPVDKIRSATVDQGFEQGMKNTGDWPFDDLEDAS